MVSPGARGLNPGSPQAVSSPTTAYHLGDLADLADRIGMSPAFVTPYADAVFAHLLLSAPPANHYALPAETLICSGHDYCRGNGAFALSVDPENTALKTRLSETAAGLRPCAPATLAEERATNPFLRVGELRPALSMANAPDAEVFARLRAMKDAF